jgi:signal transduction histidine kinase
VRTSIETGADYAIEYRTVWPDGTVRWAEIHARLVQSGGDRRLVGVSADITERKTAESNLRLLNETLEERVTQRTEELEHAHEAVLAHIAQREHAEEQLRQAQKMETIGQLTGGVAHDFNNLLMAILGNLDLLRRHVSGNPKATRLLEGALQGAERGAVLTQRLLAFARKQDLQVEPISLAELVGSMAELLERSVGTQIELRFDLSPDAPPALADANQIELALLNLVVNARDAMPGGGVLSISVDQADVRPGTDLRAGPYVRLSVTDTGDGMDADTLSKATEPFFTTKGLGRGTGLGLSMIHGLAVQLNGALILASEPGRGTVAELWLPATSARKQPEAAKKVAPAQTEVTTPMRILIVDDDPLVAMGTADMLEDLGHEVISAHSGAHALDIFQNGATVDLLITDFSMPNMTGVQLAKAIRELRPELPILLATGYAELPSSAELELPRISKPYVQAHLADALAKVMQREHTVT